MAGIEIVNIQVMGCIVQISHQVHNNLTSLSSCTNRSVILPSIDSEIFAVASLGVTELKELNTKLSLERNHCFMDRAQHILSLVKVGQSSNMVGVTTKLNVSLAKPRSNFPRPVKKFTADFHVGVVVTLHNHTVIS